MLTGLNGRIIVADCNYLEFYSLRSDTEPDDRQFDMFTWNHTMGEVNIRLQYSRIHPYKVLASVLGQSKDSSVLTSFRLCSCVITPDFCELLAYPILPHILTNKYQ